jgi:FtsH-binding integral membrane protein
MHSTPLYWLITYAAVGIFLGLTAYDTQKLKELAYATEGDPALASRLAVTGSLVLYLDFINLFFYLVQILGTRRDD